MRFYFTYAILLLLANGIFAQEINHTQYYFNLASVNPGFTGIEDYLDVKMGVRQGWNNFGEKSSNVYLGIYGTIKNSNLSPLKNSPLRLSNPEYVKRIVSNKDLRRKQGIGGMIANRDVGLYKSTSMIANYAYHLPVSDKLNWSLGAKVGFVNQKINFTGYTLRDEIKDVFYQQLKNAKEGSENLVIADFGSAIYSNNFYLGVSSSNLLLKRVGGFNLLDSEQPVHYSLQTAGNIRLGNNLLFNPGLKIVSTSGYDLNWTVNSRFRYKDLIYAGVAYEDNVKVSALFGLYINNTYSINYAYDKYLSALNNFNVSVHEVVIGISLVNRYGLKPKFW